MSDIREKLQNKIDGVSNTTNVTDNKTNIVTETNDIRSKLQSKIDNSNMSSKTITATQQTNNGNFFQKAGSTIGDLTTNIGRGFLNTLEGVVDLGRYGVAGIADFFGADEYANDVRERAKQDTTSQILKPAEDLYNQHSILKEDGIIEGIAQGIGNVGAMVGGGALLGKASTIGKYIPTTSLISGAGSGMTEAYNNGATNGQAIAYGALSGITESLSEAMFSGLGSKFSKIYGGGALDDVLIKNVTNKISNKTVQTLVQSGLKATGEGFEEIVSGLGSVFAKKLTYMNDEDITKLLSDEKLLDSFIVGTLTSAVMQTPGTINSIKTGNDYISNENVQNNTNTLTNETSAQNGLNTLQEDTTNRYIYLPTNNQKSNNLRQSATQYFSNSQETINLVDTIDKVIRDKGYNVLFDNTIVNPQGESVNAQIKALDNGEIEIRINPNSQRAGEFLLTHEITHAIETDSMKQLVMDYASKNAGFNEALESLKQTYGTTEVTDEVLADISGQLFGNQEFINNLSMEQPNIFKRIYNKIVELANKITGNSKESLFIKDLKNKWETAYRNTTTEQTISNLNNKTKYAQKILKDGTHYVETEKNLFTKKDGTAMSQREIYNSLIGKQLTFNDGITATIKQWLPNNKNMYNELFKRYPNFKNVNDIKSVNKNINENIVELLENSDNVNPNEPDYMNRHKDNKISSFDTRKVSFYDGKNAYDLDFSIAKMQDGNYVAYAKRNLSANNELLNKIKKEAPTSKSRGVLPYVDNIPQNNNNVNRNISSTKYSMQESTNNTQELDNSSFSYDNQGRTLTKEQQEYFKDSKAVDEDGNLKVLYHGTPNEFNKFSYEFLGTNGTLLGKGFYLTDDTKVAEAYANKGENGKVMELYADIKKPLKWGETTISKQQFQKFVEAVNQATEGRLFADYSGEFSEKGSQQYNSTLNDILMDYEYGGDDIDLVSGILNSTGMSWDKGYGILKDTTGYDGIIVTTDVYDSGEGNVYIPFQSNQIKSVDNTNPTSDDDIRYSQQDNTWQEHLEKNYKATGTRTNMTKLSLPKASEIQNVDNVENVPKLPKAKKDIPQDPTKESSYDNDTKKTRKQVSFELLNEMGISEQDIAKGNDISSIDLSRTDPIRVNEKVFGAKIGQKINDATINKTKHNEAERTRWLNKERDEIKSLGIKAQSKESAAVQKYGEKQYITRNNEVIPYGDAQLAKDFPNVETQNKIKKAAKLIRNKYDNYIEQINKVLVEMGYNPIKKRPDYMRHFQALNDVFSRFGTPLNAESMQNDSLPTDINGLTDQFKPGKQYFANAMQRMGLKTEYDAITGIDGYLDGASNLIFHTEDIQRYRTLSKLIRETYGSKNGYEDFANMTAKEQEQRIEDIQSNKLAKYAAWLDEQANALAGKKGKIDRGAEELFGRKVYTVLQTAKKQVGSNMTGYNVRSALTNFASAIQGASKTNKLAFLKGTMSTINNIIHNDGLIDKSDFLTSRFGSDSLSSKLWQKMSNAGQIFMKGSDYFTANQVWRSKYFENLSKGMNETQAIKNADDFASRVMGDRSKGSTATIFNSNTLGFLTQFQLEVNNQWSSLIHDNKMDVQRGNKAGASVVFQLGQLFAMSYLFNGMMKSLTGSGVMIDPIELLKKIFKPDDEEKSLEERTTEVLGEVVNNVPFASIFTGGRIPISEAFDGVATGFKFATGQTDEYGNKYTLSDVKNDMIESAFYWLLPTGYGQIKKTAKGASMYSGKLPTAGSYTDSGNLRFTADESVGGKTKALLFGQYSSKEAQDYIDSGFKTISKNHIQEMKDLGMTSTEYRNYRNGLAKAGTKNSEKLDYINSLDVSIEQKNIMANNVVDSKKYTVDMKDYSDYGSYEAMKYAMENPTNYSIITSIAEYDKYLSYKEQVSQIKDKYSNSTQRKQMVFEYINSLPYNKAQKIILFKMLGNYGISDYKNDVYNYINGLKISKKEKEQMWQQIYGK